MNIFLSASMLLLFVSLDLAAQNPAARRTSDSLVREGIRHADAGELDEALRLYDSARAVDPTNSIPVYETAYVRYTGKEYREAADLLEGILDSDRAEGGYYQLLGNCYDMLGNRDTAISTYKRGLERFPDSGPLYLELGVMSFGAKDIAAAVNYWEQGIRRNPEFPSNYYWAARAYCNSSERLWGLIYGEIFLNLERTSMRTREISRLLFDTYDSVFSFGKDRSGIRLVKQITMTPPEEGKKFKLPFEMRCQMTMAMAVVPAALGAAVGDDTTVTLALLDRIRTGFVDDWYKKRNDTVYSNVLFDWHRQLIDKGYFRAYNYWLLSEGAGDEFGEWYDANGSEFARFTEWFRKNPMPIDSEHSFSRMALLE
jgi:tetratricopeptide (TPR) repeat protein